MEARTQHTQKKKREASLSLFGWFWWWFMSLCSRHSLAYTLNILKEIQVRWRMKRRVKKDAMNESTTLYTTEKGISFYGNDCEICLQLTFDNRQMPRKFIEFWWVFCTASEARSSIFYDSYFRRIILFFRKVGRCGFSRELPFKVTMLRWNSRPFLPPAFLSLRNNRLWRDGIKERLSTHIDDDFYGVSHVMVKSRV